MHIAQVTPVYRPSIGGVENYVQRLNESLREGGHRTTTVTLGTNLDAGAPVDEADVTYASTEFSVVRNPVSVELYRTLRARRDEFDVVHLHSPWHLSTLEAVLAVGDAAPLVLTVHGAQVTGGSRLLSVLDRLYSPFARYVLSSTSTIIAQSESEREKLRARFSLDRGAVTVVPNGIPVDEYEVPKRAVSAFRERHSLDPDVPTVLYVSRMLPRKRPDVLVDAVRNRLEDRDLQVVLIGSGEPEYLAALRRAADDRFTFLSGLPFEEVKAAYHAADSFVFLGTWGEGLPTVILEAMNARLPVISTAVGAIPDVVTDGENGTLLSSPPTADALARALDRHLGEDGRTVGERNRREVRERYDWEGVADRIEGIYRSLAGDRVPAAAPRL